MDTVPEVIEKKGYRFPNGCLSVIVLFIALGVGGYFYLRSPHFSGSAAASMELAMWLPDGPSALDDQPSVQASITNKPACESLLVLLRTARLRMDLCKCGDIGALKIQYPTGETDTLRLLPGHDPASYEFRFGNGLYRLPRERFFHVLRDVGVDTTKLSERKQ
jgi:hypothetical protein